MYETSFDTRVERHVLCARTLSSRILRYRKACSDERRRIVRVDGSVTNIEWGMTPTQAGKWIAAIVTGQYDLEGDPKLYVWHHHGVGLDTRNEAIAETLAYPIVDKPVLGLIVLQAGEADFEWGTHDFNTAASVETLTYEPASGAALVKALYARIRQLESAFILPTPTIPSPTKTPIMASWNCATNRPGHPLRFRPRTLWMRGSWNWSATASARRAIL